MGPRGMTNSLGANGERREAELARGSGEMIFGAGAIFFRAGARLRGDVATNLPGAGFSSSLFSEPLPGITSGFGAASVFSGISIGYREGAMLFAACSACRAAFSWR